ncbi:MAG: hypothetical protein LQ345_003279 [Seirophora villosa]|nr:MAG: hypothetical protein LQ345_003279 [Seirophora villosa]
MLVVPMFARNFMEQLFKGVRDAVLEFMLIAVGLEFASDDDKPNMAEARDLQAFGAQKRLLRASSAV